MFKLKIITVGKTKEAWLSQGIQEYTTRLKNVMSIEWSLAKNDLQLDQYLEKEASYIALDPQGILMSSEEFSKKLHEQLLKKGSRLTLVIGGSDGLSKAQKNKADFLLSLSALTFTHQITRLVLLEQIYRAVEIEKGSAYHK